MHVACSNGLLPLPGELELHRVALALHHDSGALALQAGYGALRRSSPSQ